MRAALISEHKATPALGDRPEPEASEGSALIELRAAGLNPADVAISSGTFPAGSPPLPYVPGIEGVGSILASNRFSAGTRVWASGRGLGVAFDGTLSDRFAAPDDVLVEVPEGVDDVVAASFGVVGLAAWMPLAWLAPVRAGETVLVLGATGSVGSVAVQAAKILGAGRAVAVGRDPARLERLREFGADVAVEIGDDDFRARLAAAVADTPPTLVFDALWGPPVEAAAAVAAPGARIVNLGQSASPTATIASGLVRGKQLQILGYTNFAVPKDALAQGYADVIGHAVAGELRLDTEAVPLEDIGSAWERQVNGPGVKLVLTP
jgi:NADPH2:quinone reductase